ncbi:MAG: NfeD family protein [Proteobacteria bacterium]|nr:NfeD family protein [Burkholderiales bacterium]
MSGYVYWILIAFVLVIVELTTGTFYLLVLGLAAFAGAGAAWMGAPVWMQASLFGAVALAGVVVVWKMRAGDIDAISSNTLDIGEAVTLDHWVDRAAGVARVRYRDAVWDARVADDPAPGTAGEPGAVFYIRNVAGSVLEVAHGAPGARPGARTR